MSQSQERPPEELGRVCVGGGGMTCLCVDDWGGGGEGLVSIWFTRVRAKH
jgi:hypothetical protein